VGKFCDFQLKSPSISETVRDVHGCYGTLIGSHMRMFEVEYLKKRYQSYYRTLIGNHIKCIKWYHFQWPWLTLTVTSGSRYFSTLNISETTRDRAIFTIEHQ